MGTNPPLTSPGDIIEARLACGTMNTCDISGKASETSKHDETIVYETGLSCEELTLPKKTRNDSPANGIPPFLDLTCIESFLGLD